MHVVVTGGAGFLGSHLAERLVGDGHQVLIYDSFNKQYAPSIKRRNVATAVAMPGCTLIEGDILEGQRFDSVFSAHAVDVLVHMATAFVGPPDPGRVCMETNVLGTQSVLERCRKHGVRKAIFVSTAAVYGLRHQGPCKETDPTDRPLSVYAATKKMAESLFWLDHHRHGLEVLILRPFSVYGPRQRPDQLIYRLSRSLMAGEPIGLPGDGSSVLDLVSVDDVVGAIARAVEAVKGLEVVNLGTGTATTVADAVQKLAAAFGVTPDVRPGPPDDTLPPISLADTAKAERLLGWRAATDLDEGLRRFAGWMRAEEFADEA